METHDISGRDGEAIGAPTARHISAQGNALGFRSPSASALKGRHSRLFRPFRAWPLPFGYPGRCPRLRYFAPSVLRIFAAERLRIQGEARVGVEIRAMLAA